MPKRSNTSPVPEQSAKRAVRRSIRNMKPDHNLHIPVDIIIAIISKLDDIKDIKNCLLLSKEIHEFMYRTPEIMNKLVLVMSQKLKDLVPFLENKGKYIKRLRFGYESTSDYKPMDYILSMTPNLEELVARGDSYWHYEGLDRHEFQLPKLKHLDICTKQHFGTVLFERSMNLRDTKKLKTIKFFTRTMSYENELTELISRQEELKVLKITFSNDEVKFPTRDISNMKPQIMHLDVFGTNCCNLDFQNFVKSQGKTVKTLSMSNSGIISKRCMLSVLKTLSNVEELVLNITGYDDEGSQDPEFRLIPMPSVKKLTTFLECDLSYICAKFPNLKRLKCETLKEYSEGIFPKLEELQVNRLSAKTIKNHQLLLKKMTIRTLSFQQSDQDWLEFAKNHPDIEDLEVSILQTPQIFFCILKSLKFFKNLKNLMVSESLRNISYYSMNALKVEFKAEKNSLKVTKHMMESRGDMMNILEERFSGVEISQFYTIVIPDY